MSLEEFYKSLEDLTSEEIETISQFYSTEHLKKGSRLKLTNLNYDTLYFIEEGYIKRCSIEDDSILPPVHRPGSFFTDISNFHQGSIPKIYFEAICDCRIRSISRKEFFTLNGISSKIAACNLEILLDYCRRLARVGEIFYKLTPEQRLELLYDERIIVFQLLSNKEISQLMGIKPESLSRIMRRNRLKNK